MASGTENRQRQITLKARFNEAEAALIKEQADRAGVSVAALIRFAVLDQTPLRASRRPSVNHETAAQLLAHIGLLKSALLRAAIGSPQEAAISAACRDIADMRTALFQAMGREP
jgi:hypothetical protein